MRLPGLETTRKGVQWIRNRFIRGAVILVYHRVAALPSDPQLLSVTPEHFSEHLEILRRHTRPVSLQHLARGCRDGHVPRRTVVVTLDDGYADNLINAKPLLERYDIPATIFVTTGYTDHPRELWTDQLERLLLQPGTLPNTLQLVINRRPYRWSLGEGRHYSEDAYRRYRSWNLLSKACPSSRQRLYRALHQLLRPVPESDRRRILDDLTAWASADPTPRPTHRTLSAGELLSMADGGLIEVGAHTVTHPVLSALPASMQEAEITASKAHLEQILDSPVRSFAYSYGYRSDYTGQTVSIVRRSGFTCACSAFPDVVWRRTDVFQLPRLAAFDWDGAAFSRRLESWLREDLQVCTS
jgi:peptidoglycan/xylan/chitin deacetylase (PgdA/CDA1 family)